MFGPLRIGAIALGAAVLGCCGVWAGVIVRTGADGSVTVVTDSLSVQNRPSNNRVLVDTHTGDAGVSGENGDRSYTQSFSSFSSSSSSSRSSSISSSSSIPYAHLSRADYLLLVSGSGNGNVKINGQSVANLNRIVSFRLNSYLRRGNNSISMSGQGSAQLQIALVEAEKGSRPYFSGNGRVVGARQVLMQQQQSRSGGSWTSGMAISID